MSAKDLFYGDALTVSTSVVPAVTATNIIVARQFVVYAAGAALCPASANTTTNISIAGVTQNDLVFVTNNSSNAADKLLPASGAGAAGGINITVAGTPAAGCPVTYLVVRVLSK